MAVAMSVGVSALQKENPTSRGPRKGDTVVVRGCLTGQALEATDLSWADATGLLSSGTTFRLTGDKSRLKQLRDEHDGKVVEVEGVLKSELPKESAATRTVGKVRITIGTPSTPATSREDEARRSLPVLEVKSYEGGTVTCGR